MEPDDNQPVPPPTTERSPTEQVPAPPPPAEDTAPARLLARLGPRAARRAAPRVGPVLGGAGAVLAIAGVLILSFDSAAPDSFDDDPDTLAGALFCALTVAAGYTLIVRFRATALATFGSVVATAALPFVFVFLTYDEDKASRFSVDATLLLSIALWTIAYLAGPARGRPALLGAALAGLWLFVVEQVEAVVGTPALLFGGFLFGDISGGAGPATPDAGTIGVISLLFGAGYIVAGFWTDIQRLLGLATPLLVVGIVALATGFAAASEDLEPAGTGILMMITGAVILFVASRRGRRGTSWVSGAAVAIGAFLVVADIFDDADDPSGPALALVVIGIAVAAGGEWWAMQAREPSELALEPPPPDDQGHLGPLRSDIDIAP